MVKACALIFLLARLLALKVTNNNLRSNAFPSIYGLIIVNGGIGDILIAIKVIKNSALSPDNYTIITDKKYFVLFDLHLHEWREKLLDKKRMADLELNIYSDIYLFRTKATDILIILRSNFRNRIHLNPLYDELRLISRILSKLSSSYRKFFYKGKHIQQIFEEMLSLDVVKGIGTARPHRTQRHVVKKIGFHVAGSDSIRKLKKEVIIEVVTSFPEVEFILLGSEEDASTYGDLQIRLKNFKNLIGKLSFTELDPVIRSLDMIIAPDSMMLHYCSLVNLPVVALMGNALPQTYGPLGVKNLVLSRNPSCSPCGVTTCKKYSGYSCVQDIDADMIRHAVKEMLL